MKLSLSLAAVLLLFSYSPVLFLLFLLLSPAFLPKSLLSPLFPQQKPRFRPYYRVFFPLERVNEASAAEESEKV